jgi:hypothetical protein
MEGVKPRRPAPPRELTPAEVSVISSLLAAEPANQRDRILASGLSPRTYEVARRRVFDAGWIHERFVPDPLAWGFSTLQLLLEQPRPGTEDASVTRLLAAPGVFLIWQGAGVVFSASFHKADSETGLGGPSSSSAGSDAIWRLSLDLKGPSVPVYFDFEGAWSRVVGAAGPRIYPRPLPRWSGGGAAEEELPTPRLRRDAEALIRRPFAQRGGPLNGKHLGSIVGLGAGRGALASGLVERRCFPDLGRLPGYQGWSLRSVGFQWGKVKAGHGPEALYQELLQEGGMTPFLFATDRRSVLIGALSPAPQLTLARDHRRISEILVSRLESSRFVSAPVSSLSSPVNHRYDRLLPARLA